MRSEGNVLLNSSTHSPIPLAMERMELTGTVTPVGALLTTTHSFKCAPGAQPMEAVYVFQLPRGGAVRRYKVKGKDFEVDSVLTPREDARKEYEAGIQAGHLSTLAETDLDGMVTIMVGQVQPEETITIAVETVCGIELQDNSYRLRFPFTLAPNYHSKASMISVPGGMKIELPQDVFGEMILPEWKEDASGLHEIGFRLHLEVGGCVDLVASPSHNISVQPNTDGSADIWLAGMSAQPDRDLVVDVGIREATSVVFADDSLVQGIPPKEGKPSWMVSIPSGLLPKAPDVPRKVLFLLDKSGSMHGVRITQALAALKVCLSGLSAEDQFGLIRFSSGSEAFHSTMAPATDDNRARAARWLAETMADGGTELASALKRAVKLLDGAGGDMFLITDGEVSETGPIIESLAACKIRVHILGIGSAAQDRFLAQLARRTGGAQKMLNPSENVALGAMELFNAIKQPRQSGVKAVVLGGFSPQTHDIGDIWDGRPLFITDKGSSGLPAKVIFSWGQGSQDVSFSDKYKALPDGTVGFLWAGRQVEDLETAIDTAKTGPARKALEMALKVVSTDYGIASRVMSLVAIIKRVGDQAGVTPEQRVIPVGLSLDSGLRRSLSASACTTRGLSSGVTKSSSQRYLSMSSMQNCFDGGTCFESPRDFYPQSVDSLSVDLHCEFLPNVHNGFGGSALLELMAALGQLQSDGGLPGQTMQSRIAKTLVLALALLQQTVDTRTTTYLVHMKRMAEFLELSGIGDSWMPKVVAMLRASSEKVSGDWVSRYRSLGEPTLESIPALMLEIQTTL